MANKVTVRTEVEMDLHNLESWQMILLTKLLGYDDPTKYFWLVDSQKTTYAFSDPKERARVTALLCE